MQTTIIKIFLMISPLVLIACKDPKWLPRKLPIIIGTPIGNIIFPAIANPINAPTLEEKFKTLEVAEAFNNGILLIIYKLIINILPAPGPKNPSYKPTMKHVITVAMTENFIVSLLRCFMLLLQSVIKRPAGTKNKMI